MGKDNERHRARSNPFVYTVWRHLFAVNLDFLQNALQDREDNKWLCLERADDPSLSTNAQHIVSDATLRIG